MYCIIAECLVMIVSEMDGNIKVVRTDVGLAVYLPRETAQRFYYKQDLDSYFIIRIHDIDDKRSSIYVVTARRDRFLVNVPFFRLHSFEVNVSLCRMMRNVDADWFKMEKEWFAKIRGVEDSNNNIVVGSCFQNQNNVAGNLATNCRLRIVNRNLILCVIICYYYISFLVTCKLISTV